MFMRTVTRRWNAKFFGLLLVSIMLAGISLSATATSSLDSSVTIPSSGAIATSGSNYTANAVWIMGASWGSFASNERYVLTQHLSDVVANLTGKHIEFAFTFVGYWNPTTSIIGYTMTDAQITTMITALHGIGIKVLAWAEDNGAIDVTAANRANLYAAITNCMNKGFDGYHDDIESYTGTLQDWINYENNATVVLHGLGKLMTAAVAFDWAQNTNQYLHMDYIVSMFYGSHSTFEDSQAAAYWQEDFGEYSGHNTPPASPMIIGIMNAPSPYNTQPLTYQLTNASTFLSAYRHPQLVGFCIWLYEFMGARSDGANDWSVWNSWIMTVG